MKFQFIQEPHKKPKGLRTVEMDEGIIYLKEDLGFNTYGVASCIVFVAYYHNKPLFMLHWSTPDSKARLSEVNQNVICLLQALEDSLSMHEIDLNMVTSMRLVDKNLLITRLHHL